MGGEGGDLGREALGGGKDLEKVTRGGEGRDLGIIIHGMKWHSE
jgi:hypothetical protein